MQRLAVVSSVDRAGHLVEHRPGGEQFGGTVGQHARHQLMLAQGLAVHHPVLRERRGLVDQALSGANASRGHHHSLEPEPVLGERHRSALGPDKVGRGHPHVVERHDRMLVGDVVRILRRANHFHARPRQVDDQQHVLASTPPTTASTKT